MAIAKGAYRQWLQVVNLANLQLPTISCSSPRLALSRILKAATNGNWLWLSGYSFTTWIDRPATDRWTIVGNRSVTLVVSLVWGRVSSSSVFPNYVRSTFTESYLGQGFDSPHLHQFCWVCISTSRMHHGGAYDNFNHRANRETIVGTRRSEV